MRDKYMYDITIPRVLLHSVSFLLLLLKIIKSRREVKTGITRGRRGGGGGGGGGREKERGEGVVVLSFIFLARCAQHGVFPFLCLSQPGTESLNR